MAESPKAEQNIDAHFFFSYSRRQFYFAESLVLHLQKEGIPLWFDVQQLAPGEMWRGEIEHGIQEARGCIVLASRASMASAYVRQEWEPMLAAGKPVYIVIFESCTLPPELAQGATAIIDMRGRFRKKLMLLVGILRDNKPPVKQRIPKPAPFHLPTRLSFGVGVLVTTYILLCTIFALLIWTLTADTLANFIMMCLFLWVAFTLGDALLDILRRQHTFFQLWVTLGLSMLLFLSAPIFWFIPLGGLAALFFSEGVYRWMPTGQAPSWMRKKYGGTTSTVNMRDVRRQLNSQAPPRSQRYTIYYSPEDEPLAKDIQEILMQDGHVCVEHNEAADQHILILSNASPRSILEEMVIRHPNTLTPVVASNVDARAEIDALGNFQFVDYRRHSREQIEAMSLVFQYPEEGKIIYGMNVLPQNPQTPIFPTGVRRFAFLSRIIAGVYVMGASIALVDALKLLNSTTTSGAEWYLLTLWGVMAAWTYYMLHRLLHREVSSQQHRFTLYGQVVGSIFALTLGIPQILMGTLSYRAIQHWLPNKPVHSMSKSERLQAVGRYTILWGAVRDVALVSGITILMIVYSRLSPNT